MASTLNKKSAPSVGKENKSSQRSPQPEVKTPNKNKFQGSMGLGLLMIVVGTSSFGLGGLGYLFYQELLSSSQRAVDRANEAQTRHIESKLANVRQSAESLANAAKSLALQTPKPKTAEMYQKLVLESLQSSEAIAGLGIAQNENQLFVSPKPVVPYIWTEQSGLKPEIAGKKLPTPNDKLFVASRPDIFTNSFYKTAISKSKASWSEPYSASGKSIITYFAPIGDPTKPLGIVQADAIASNVLAIAPTTGKGENKIRFVVVGSGGQFIIGTDTFASLQSQNPMIAESLNNIAQQSKAKPTETLQTGGNLWSYRKIEGSDLLVAAYLPESEITNKLIVLVGGAALGISAILAIAILGFVASLKKRLQPMIEECDRFLTMQGTKIVQIDGQDEIDYLTLSLKDTFEKVKSSEFRLGNELIPNPIDPESTPQSQQNFAETELMEAEVGDLLDVVSSMEEGDLTIEAQVNDRATGLVADTLNRLREKLVEIISSVLATAQQVAQGASDLEELTRTVVLNTAEQAESVAQGQALTEQVAAIATQSSAQVNVANQSLQEVSDTVASGQTAINTLTDSISVLQTGSAQIVQRMKTLGEFVGLAEQFVQDQGQIASLTQVLALNATLVAARAAEQKDPKQFASVAREFESIAGQVNDLATQTNDGLTVLQQRTSQIQTVVTAIDVEVQNLSGLVAGFTTGVEDSQSAFNNIQTATEEVVQIGLTITKSSTEIADAAGSTASYISEIAQLAERTANLTRSARQQSESMGYQAQQLLQGIQFFRLPEVSAPVYPSSTEFDNSIDNFVDYSHPEPNVEANLDSSLGLPEDKENGALGLVVPAIALASATFAISQSGQKNSLEFTDSDLGLDLGSVQDQDFILDSSAPIPDSLILDDFVPDNLVPDNLVPDNLVEDTLVPDDFAQDSLVQDTLVPDDFAQDSLVADNFIQDTLVPDNFIQDTLVADNFIQDTLVPDSFIQDTLGSDNLVPHDFVTDSLVQDNFVTDHLILDNLISKDESTSIFLDTTHDEPTHSDYSPLTDISLIEESLFADLKHEIYAGDSFGENGDSYVEGVEEFSSLDAGLPLENLMDGVDEIAIDQASSDPIVASATSLFLEDTTLGSPSSLSQEVLSNLPTSFDFSVPDLDYIDYSDDALENPQVTLAPSLEAPSLEQVDSFFDGDVDLTQQIEERDSGFDVFAPEQSVNNTNDVLDNIHNVLDDAFDDAFDDISQRDVQFDDPFENLDLSQTVYATGLSGLMLENSTLNSDTSYNFFDNSDLSENIDELANPVIPFDTDDSFTLESAIATDSDRQDNVAIAEPSTLGVSELLELPIDSSDTFSFGVDSKENAEEMAVVVNPLLNPLDDIHSAQVSATETAFPSLFDAVTFDEDEDENGDSDDFAWQSETNDGNLDLNADPIPSPDLFDDDQESTEIEILSSQLPDFTAIDDFIADSNEIQLTELPDLQTEVNLSVSLADSPEVVDTEVNLSVSLADSPDVIDSVFDLPDIPETFDLVESNNILAPDLESDLESDTVLVIDDSFTDVFTDPPLNETLNEISTEAAFEPTFSFDLSDEDSDEFDAFQQPIEEVCFDAFDSLLGDEVGEEEEFNQPDGFSPISVIVADESIVDSDGLAEAIAPDILENVLDDIESVSFAEVWESSIQKDDDIDDDNYSIDYEDSAIFGIVSNDLEDSPALENFVYEDAAIFDSLASDLEDYSLENYTLDDSGADLEIPTNSSEDTFGFSTFEVENRIEDNIEDNVEDNIEKSNVDSSVDFANQPNIADDNIFDNIALDINSSQIILESTEESSNFSIDFSDDWLVGVVDDETDDDNFSAIAEIDSSMLDISNYAFANDLLDSLMDESEEDLSMDLPDIGIDSSWLPNSIETEVKAEVKVEVGEIDSVVATVKQEPVELESDKDPIAKVKSARDEIADFLLSTLDLEQS